MNCEDILENVVANLEKQAGVVDSVKTAGNYLKDKGIAAAGYAKNKAGMAGSYAKDKASAGVALAKKHPGKAAAIAGGALAAGGAGYALSKKAERKNTPASAVAGTATGAAIGAAAHNLGQAKNRERNAKVIVNQLKTARGHITPMGRKHLADAGRYARHGAKVARNRAALLGAAALGLGATIPALQKKAGIKDLAKHLAAAKSKAGTGAAQAHLLAGVAAAKGKQAIRNNPKKALAAAVPVAAGAAYGAHRALKKEASLQDLVDLHFGR